LLLARLFARPANVLVLAEPTNDLDIDTLELLEDLLQQYEGTVFLVSHDRRFLDNVVTSTIVSEGEGRWREYVGDVQDWLTQSARSEAMQREKSAAGNTNASKAANTAAVAGPPAAAPAPAPKKKLSYKEQREYDALPERIAKLEAEQAEINQQLNSGQLYAADAARAAQLGARHAEIEGEWLQAMERWEALGGS
jgi:ATP-binding cassette subfamily F protein uup